MIIDSFALIAILRDEPEAMTCARTIEAASHRRISAVNFVVSAIVIDGSRDPVASRRFDDLVKAAQLVVEPVTGTASAITISGIDPRPKPAALGRSRSWRVSYPSILTIRRRLFAAG